MNVKEVEDLDTSFACWLYSYSHFVLSCRGHGSCCEARGGSARVQTLKNMKKRASALGDIAALFSCDAWSLGQDHGVLDK